ncbi:Acyl-CoA synthetase (AMP-forming)/AMP-acid ligase II [Lentzea xinjiangensis]|uniref:Acyl-CoA synthetase (AMP-forming)/AMP-acid ligase II n=1 Tax=Lentzea xinjiangensis TaxID=402600 RepID=A0A1H9SZE0_9PSEU|nr:class I adenylate-forming enzyme family protein [Lentzea xinjiangensis]SER90261.1 Acyl-CoA synthetase (AMP-forming)/AMP-acid ligase II [Lentzea xinjiangensis]
MSAELALTRDVVEAFLSRVDDPGHDRPVLDDVLEDMATLGLPAGGVVVLALANGAELLSHYFAVLVSGLVPLAVSPATPSARLAELLRRVGAKALITKRAHAAVRGVGSARRIGSAQVIVVDRGPHSDVAPGDVLMLTSGTSGSYSACVHRVGSLLRNASRHALSVELHRDDVVLVTLPLHYSYAMVAQVFAALVSGAGLVVTGPPFAPPSFLSVLKGHLCTSSSITPTMARSLLVAGDRLPRVLRALTVGGDQINADHVQSLLALHPQGELYLTYGLTEAGPRVSTLAAHAEPARRHSSVGLPMPGVSASIRDGASEGELLVESDTVLVCKIGAAQPFVRPGVIATGDVFWIDDGYLYFRGRKSDFVVVRGEKVSLTTVRQAAAAVPGVLSCTPRVESTEDGEVHLDLEVVVADGGTDTARRVRSALAASLLPAERPRRIVVSVADPMVFQK